MIDQFAALGKTNFVGKDGFNWWIGQVAPPKSWRDLNIVQSQRDFQHNRVKVRIIGYHPFDPKGLVLPDEDLPWAEVMIPTHSGSGQNGLGENMILSGGETCLGFFLDGDDAQQPVIMGLLPDTNKAEKVIKNSEIDQVSSSGFLPFESSLRSSARTNDSCSIDQSGKPICVIPNNGEGDLIVSKGQASAESNATRSDIAFNICSDTTIGRTQQAVTDFIQLLQGVENIGSNFIDPLTNAVVNMQAELSYVTAQVAGIMRGTINSIKTNLLKNLNKKFKKLLGPIKAGAKGVDSFFDEIKLKKGFKGIMGLLYCAFENALGGIGDFIGNMFQNLIGKVVNGAACAIEQFTAGLFAKLFDSLEGSLGTLMSGLNWLVGGFNSVKNVLRSASGFARKILAFIDCNEEPCVTPSAWVSNVGIKSTRAENYGKFMDQVGTLGGLKDGLAGIGTRIDAGITGFFGNDSPVSSGSSMGSIERAIDQISLFGSGNNQFDSCNKKNDNPTSQEDVVPVKPGYIYPKCIPPEVEVIGSGEGAELFIVVGNDRRIFSVEVINGGSGYDENDTSISIIDNTGNGSGADVRAIVKDGVITDAVIFSTGSGYCLNTVGLDPTTNVGVGTNVIGTIKDTFIVKPGINYDPNDTISFVGVDDGTSIPIITTPSGSIAVVDFPDNINTEFSTAPELVVNTKTGVGANIIPIMSFKGQLKEDVTADERRARSLIGIEQVIDCIGDNKEVVGYVNGVAYSGPYHVMSNGLKMTGATHSGSDSIIYDTIEESFGEPRVVSRTYNTGVTTTTTETATQQAVDTTPTIVTEQTTSTTPMNTDTTTNTPTDTSTSTDTDTSSSGGTSGYGGY